MSEHTNTNVGSERAGWIGTRLALIDPTVEWVAFLAISAHGGPALAVTVLVGFLAVALGATATTVLLIMAAVFAGQLSIGWSNDLIDAARDREVGRTDKPLAMGRISVDTVRLACSIALLVTLGLSILLGPGASLVHVGCVAAGWFYNLGVKATAFSWVPYAVAFGGYPLVAAWVVDSTQSPPWWLMLTGALLGVGAHLLNVLPDLADDAKTGVRGLPHRLGARRATALALVVLITATGVICLTSDGPVWLLVTGFALACALGGGALVTSGRTPFRIAISIALVTVALLVATTGNNQ